MNWKRYVPLLVILLLMALVYFSGVTQYLSFEQLKEHRNALQELTVRYPYGAPLLFMLVYTTVIALSLPGGAVLSIFAGFLFPQPFCTFYVLLAATVGAIIIFSAAQTAFGHVLEEKAGRLLQKLEKGLKEDGWSYLLFLRLVPVFPFWLVNLAPAFFGISLFTFTWTTFVGIIPGAFVFTQAGTGLGAIFDSGEAFSIGAIFNTQVKIALLALGVFALLPILVKKLWKRRSYD